jgi:hypothetical protein
MEKEFEKNMCFLYDVVDFIFSRRLPLSRKKRNLSAVSFLP